MALKVYGDRLGQPLRAVIIFCKVNGIDFEEVELDTASRQHMTPEYQEINPMRKMPAIVDGRFKLFESHAIMIYLASVFPGVPDHWYPSDPYKRAKIHSVLDWHHSNLRLGSAKYHLKYALAPVLRLPPNPKEAAEGEELLSASLATIESFWLEGNRPFLLGNLQPSIADLSLVCEIAQLEAGDEKDRDRILSPHKRIVKWIEDTKNATRPHFDEVHASLFKIMERLRMEHLARRSGKSKVRQKNSPHSKL